MKPDSHHLQRVRLKPDTSLDARLTVYFAKLAQLSPDFDQRLFDRIRQYDSGQQGSLPQSS